MAQNRSSLSLSIASEYLRLVMYHICLLTEFLELHQKLSAMSVPESEPEIESSQTPKLR